MQPCSLRIYSVFGRPIATSDVHTDEERRQFSSEGYPLATELFTNGVRTVFWGPGGYNLFVCTAPSRPPSSDGTGAYTCMFNDLFRSVADVDADRGHDTKQHGQRDRGDVALTAQQRRQHDRVPTHPEPGQVVLLVGPKRYSLAPGRLHPLVPQVVHDRPAVRGTLSILPEKRVKFLLQQNNAKFPVLVGVTALLIDVPSLENQHTLRPDVRRWRQTQISPAYGAENWPIKYVAANAQGNMFALAGQRGFAILNSTLDKWKLFGNLQHVRYLIKRSIL